MKQIGKSTRIMIIASPNVQENFKKQLLSLKAIIKNFQITSTDLVLELTIKSNISKSFAKIYALYNYLFKKEASTPILTKIDQNNQVLFYLHIIY